jgi:malate dehydrogenase (oxaloacetate-decarboxylating)
VVAINVARTAVEQGVSSVDIEDITETVRTAQWWPVYCPVDAI